MRRNGERSRQTQTPLAAVLALGKAAEPDAARRSNEGFGGHLKCVVWEIDDLTARVDTARLGHGPGRRCRCCVHSRH